MWFFILSALLGVESPVLKAGSLACRGAVILPPAPDTVGCWPKRND